MCLCVLTRIFNLHVYVGVSACVCVYLCVCAYVCARVRM